MQAFKRVLDKIVSMGTEALRNLILLKDFLF